MSVGERDQAVVEAYFRAMQAGAAGGDEMMVLFAEDAVYVEPFTGQARTHTGRAAIRQNFIDSQRYAPPDMRLTLDRVDLAGDQIRSEWTCTSPAFPHPMHGQDLWTLRDGKIIRLETSLASG